MSFIHKKHNTNSKTAMFAILRYHLGLANVSKVSNEITGRSSSPAKERENIIFNREIYDSKSSVKEPITSMQLIGLYAI